MARIRPYSAERRSNGSGQCSGLRSLDRTGEWPLGTTRGHSLEHPKSFLEDPPSISMRRWRPTKRSPQGPIRSTSGDSSAPYPVQSPAIRRSNNRSITPPALSITGGLPVPSIPPDRSACSDRMVGPDEQRGRGQNTPASLHLALQPHPQRVGRPICRTRAARQSQRRC